MNLRRLLKVDWDAIAGIVAATLAVVLHFLHIISTDVLLTIAVVLVALLFIRNLRKEPAIDEILDLAYSSRGTLSEITAALAAPDTMLIGPASIVEESKQFGQQARGEMVWFHVCLSMFRPQLLFDILLRPAIENESVTSIVFVLDDSQRDAWNADVLPKVRLCEGASKVSTPIWTSIDSTVSLVISEWAKAGSTTCLMSFWGEPFMARSGSREIPRYVFRVFPQSELIPRMVDLVREHRLGHA